MYDKDVFTNDMIGEVQIDLRQIVEDCSATKKPIALNKDYYEEVLNSDKEKPFMKLKFDKDNSSRFWVGLKARNDKTR